MNGSLSRADIYGVPSAAGAPRYDPISTRGANQGSVANPESAKIGGGGIGAAASWVGFVLLLVLLRIAVELGGKLA